MHDLIFRGVATALVTPFDKQGEKINYSKLESLINYQINSGVDALLIGGTTGESATLTFDEKKELVKFAVKAVNKRVPIIAGAGTNCTAESVSECQVMEECGADALLLITPYYNKCSPKGLYLHYKSCAESCGLPFVLYNVPSRTGYNIHPVEYEQLLKIKNVKAVKEASGNIEQAMQIKSLYEENISVYCGCDQHINAMLAAGADGAISVLSNLYPAYVHEMCARFFSGDTESSFSLQKDSYELIRLLFSEVNPIPVKTAMNLLGLDVGEFRLPLCEASKNTVEALKNELQKFKSKI